MSLSFWLRLDKGERTDRFRIPGHMVSVRKRTVATNPKL